MSDDIDVLVIGAGVVGLAVGRAFAKAGREVVIAEKHSAIGTETSSRNSEVIHAGIYYKPGGMRARLCVPGRRALYTFLRDHHVPFVQCGKLITAHDETEISTLKMFMERARQNGVEDLRLLNGSEAQSSEPQLECVAAVHSPSTGVLDSHGFMLALQGELEAAGGALAFNAPVINGAVTDDKVTLTIGEASSFTVRCRLVVNCAGLWADRVARSITGLPPSSIPTLKYGKGVYFAYSGKPPFTHLIYPTPPLDTQGVHYTRNFSGRAKFGPDLEYVESNEDYDVDPDRLAQFLPSIRRFWPAIDEGKLHADYAGIRPKTAGPGEEGDFIFSGPQEHGVEGYIGLYGIESPGLTSALAIGEHVLSLAG